MESWGSRVNKGGCFSSCASFFLIRTGRVASRSWRGISKREGWENLSQNRGRRASSPARLTPFFPTPQLQLLPSLNFAFSCKPPLPSGSQHEVFTPPFPSHLPPSPLPHLRTSDRPSSSTFIQPLDLRSRFRKVKHEKRGRERSLRRFLPSSAFDNRHDLS